MPLLTTQKQSSEELYQDIFISLLMPNIQTAVDHYYKNYLTQPPIITPDYVYVINAEIPMGYRSFVFSLKLKVSSYIGSHLNIGDDYITFKIEGGDKVSIEKFEHIKSYYLNLPPNYLNIIIKKEEVIRAEGISKFGKLVITANSEEKTAQLGADSVSRGKYANY